MSAQRPSLNALSSIHEDGSRDHIHPADVHGRWATLRNWVFVVLIAIYVVLPWIQIGGHPAIRIDIPKRHFYLFGATFNAQDFWLAFFFLFGVALALVILSSVLGRVWCGFACPQTVFLEGVFRRIERIIEGPRNQRLKRNKGPWNWDKLWRKALKQALFILLSVLIAHVFLSYFTSMEELLEMVRQRPTEHPVAFAWMFGMSVVMYFNFFWFREQLCLAICPYGRLQSALCDDDTVIIGYDEARGEPRGKARKKADAAKPLGDCVDCRRCVMVCPTGIDIRNGLQMECIGCTACIDACDEIMDKLDRPRGLIRFDSLLGLARKPRRVLRPRLFIYAAVLVIWAAVFAVAAGGRSSFEADVLRPAGLPYTIAPGDAGQGEVVRNPFTVHLVNKEDRRRRFLLELDPRPGVVLTIPNREYEVAAMADARLPFFAAMPRSEFSGQFQLTGRVVALENGAPTTQVKEIVFNFKGPYSSKK